MKPPSDHIESARTVLAIVPAVLSALQAEYMQCVHKLEVSQKFQVQTQSFLTNLRSILEYLAQDFVRFCTSRRKDVYFPIATTGTSEPVFKGMLAKWFPGLHNNKPALFDYLLKLQHFYPGNDWLPAFKELSNKNKHVTLSRMEMGGFDAAVIRLYGKPLMQFGARGIETLKLGGTLRFRSGSNQACLRGPQIIDRNTKKLLFADPGLDIVTATWTEFRFDEFPHQPAIVFLETAEREIRRISEKIETLI